MFNISSNSCQYKNGVMRYHTSEITKSLVNQYTRTKVDRPESPADITWLGGLHNLGPYVLSPDRQKEWRS